MKHWALVGTIICIGTVFIARSTLNRRATVDPAGVDVNRLPPQYVPSTLPASATTEPISGKHAIGVPIDKLPRRLVPPATQPATPQAIPTH